MILDILVRYRTWIGYFFFITCIVLLCLDLQHVQNKYLKQKLLTQELEARVDYQNAEVERYAADAARLKVVAERAMTEAKKVETVHITKAQRILVEAPTNSDECVSALELLRKYQ